MRKPSQYFGFVAAMSVVGLVIFFFQNCSPKAWQVTNPITSQNSASSSQIQIQVLSNAPELGTAMLSSTSSPQLGQPASITGTFHIGTSVAVTDEQDSCPKGAPPLISFDSSANMFRYTYQTGPLQNSCKVTMKFSGSPDKIVCPDGRTMPGRLVEKNASPPWPSATLQEVWWHPGPEDVYAFRLEVPENLTQQIYRMVHATATPNSTSVRMVVISECPGDYDTAGKDYGCHIASAEDSTPSFVINTSEKDAPRDSYCHLTPGKTYWVNVSARFTPQSEPSCSDNVYGSCWYKFSSN